MPEHALRAPATLQPHRSRLARIWRNAPRPRFGGLRRGKMAIATCAIAGAAVMTSCTPGQVAFAQHQLAVGIAHQYLGTPYVYGGARPGGFDCSGLTQWVYGRIGKYLPRSAEQQFEYVQKIPQSWAAPGDLIFFGSPGAIYHVGIYQGNGMIEHAPSPGNYVRIIPIWTSQYYVGRVN